MSGGTHFRLRDVDRGYAALVRRIQNNASHRLAVGVLAQAGARRQRGSKLTVLAVAIIQEFGGGHVPERSFIRAWADERRSENAARIRRAAQQIIRGADPDRVMRAVGADMVEDVRARMRRGIRPALDPDTLREKGSATPLVGGQLIDAIGFEVRS